jgi:MFS family permease
MFPRLAIGGCRYVRGVIHAGDFCDEFEPGILVLLTAFVLAGIGIGFVETAEAAAVASMADDSIRGSASGLLAGAQSLGNFAASAIAGVLWTVVSPTVAFLWLSAWMAVACIAFLTTPGNRTGES